MSPDDAENLLRANFAELLLFEQGRQFIHSSNANASFSIKIVKKLQSLVRTKILDLDTLHFTVDVIASCNETTLPLAVNLLLDEFLLHSNQDDFNRTILLKRTFSMLDQLLRQLMGDDGLSDMEMFENTITVDLVDRLTKLKGKYVKSEL